jgi:uncharacterized protein
MIVVSDTSPITYLLQISRLSLLNAMYGRVLIPPTVQRELSHSHPELPPFIETWPVSDNDSVVRLSAELDQGEAEAIILAKETKADLLLIDERPGRSVAVREGLRITGLLGVLVEAKQLNLISSVRDIVFNLEKNAGFHVSEQVKNEAFRAGDEA